MNATGEKRGRGRPRKYLPNFPGDFETNKYDSFFNNANRKRDDTKTWELSTVLHNGFNFLFKGEYRDKLFSRPEKIEDTTIFIRNIIIPNPILTNMVEKFGFVKLTVLNTDFGGTFINNIYIRKGIKNITTTWIIPVYITSLQTFPISLSQPVDAIILITQKRAIAIK